MIKLNLMYSGSNQKVYFIYDTQIWKKKCIVANSMETQVKYLSINTVQRPPFSKAVASPMFVPCSTSNFASSENTIVKLQMFKNIWGVSLYIYKSTLI